MPETHSTVPEPDRGHDQPEAAVAWTTLEQRTAIRDICGTFAAQSRTELLLFEHSLDPRIYDHPPFLAGVKQLALARPELPVRVLLVDPRQTIARGHRFIELARRLTSRIAIRRLGEDFQDRADAFLIVDRRAVVRRSLASNLTAVSSPHAPGEARRLRLDFNEMWEHSDSDIELRTLEL